MRIILLILLLTLISCQKRKPYVDPDLEPYVAKYEGIVGHETNASVVYGSITIKDAIGYCQNHKVTILKSFFIQTDEITREILIFHELIHCDQGYFRHDNTFAPFKFTGYGSDNYGNESTYTYPSVYYGTHPCPNSIERWYMFNMDEINRCYLNHLAYYYNDMKNK